MDRDLIGWVLVGAGVLDVVTAVAIVRPRLPEKTRGTVTAAVAVSGVSMVLLGACFLGRLF